MELEYQKTTVGNIGIPVQATGICLNYFRFANDVRETTLDGFDGYDSHPLERYDRKLNKILKKIYADKQSLPCLFSVRLDKGMSVADKQTDFVFEVTEKSYFERKCRCAGQLNSAMEILIADVDCVIRYLGMETNRQDGQAACSAKAAGTD